MKEKIKYIFIVLFLLFCFIFINMSSYANTISQNLSENFFRLHILANSNSKQDQELKLKVRDKIIEYMNTQNLSDISKQDVVYQVSENLNIYTQIAESVIQDAGFDYPVTVEVGNYLFPTKKYGNLSLPAGNYDALRIKIGNASGENWWCSLFPPLCFVDISSGVIDEDSENSLKKDLSSEEFAIIKNSNTSVKLKFKIVEFFSK
jgi:stage II sporulation protein R